ncbi:class I SAM-dependent methyltransferase [Azospirillum picis]|uniref:SAM-dependent methyltransferase n=1 Tax=Azospirillum picis TaxID=488438 RepID=A0ABU0MDC0_9PROT|nr:class I SAM-dependent methyltransferase [Azospirillum picis]MBP2297599.1 SAM-dependent methyltransferase [Azospirillum picis]MDQ0531378.1 SAM-dependent methyltransferase [Azospirillum picis]
MSDTDKLFAGSIPALYDRHLGPLLFSGYARDLAGRLAGLEGSLLETAAGTGIVTRALVEALPAGTAITATDLNQPMLDHAASALAAPQVTWRQADALALPFEPSSFDAVVCQFGVMFFPDKPAGFAEARRVLRAGGQFLFSVWDRIEDNEIPAVVHDTMLACFPDDPPGFMRRTPYGYHDTDRIRRELLDAGFRHVEIETVTLRGRAPGADGPAVGFCKGSPLRHEIETRDAGRLDEVTDRLRQALARRFGPGPIDGKLQAHVIAARR